MWRYLTCIRYRDVFVLQGTPLLGVAFTVREITPGKVPSLLLFSLASVLLVAHTFGLNDWAGIAADVNDPNKRQDVFLSKGISRQGIGRLVLGLGLLSLLLFSLLSVRVLLLATGILLLGLLYSHPSIHAKGIPIVSSGVHLVGGVLHFLLGYSLFSGVDGRGMLIALYFAVIFVAGHLNQEVRDYEADRLNGIVTNGVRFGKQRVFITSFLLFTLSYAYLWGLARSGVVPPALGYVNTLYPLHGYLFWRTLRAGLTFHSVSRLQASYRALYAVIGLFMGVIVLLT